MIGNKILFIGSFKKPQNGHYGGVYFASTTLRDGLTKEGYNMVEMDTTLNDISETRVHKRLPNIIKRQFKFLYTTVINSKAKHIFIFLSGGGSYIDKFFPILVAKLRGKKTVIFPVSGHLINDFNKKKFKFFIKRVFKMADTVVCQSSFWKEYFISNGVDPDKLLIIENWVDDSKIKESASLNYPKFNGKDKETFKIIFVSRIEKAKGVDDLIALAKQLSNKLDFSIHVYGAGSYQEEFISRIKNNNLDKVILFKGWLNQEKMLEVINQHHLAIFSSRTEGYPNGLLDYIFSKVPVLSSDIPMVKAVGMANMAYYRNENIIEMAEKVLETARNYSIAIDSTKKLHKEKSLNNSIDSAINNIKMIL